MAGLQQLVQNQHHAELFAILPGAGASWHKLDVDGDSSSFPFDYDGTTDQVTFFIEAGIGFPAGGFGAAP